MKLAGAALGHDANLATRGSAIFRSVAGGENLHFRGVIEIGGSDGFAI